MKKILYKFVALTFVVGLFSSIGCTKGDGNIVSEEITAREFCTITINGAANVNVQHGEDYRVVVTTDNNLQSFVLVEAKNNVLHISTKRNANIRTTKLIVDVYLPELQGINSHGVGNVKLPDGNASNLEISLTGVGNIDGQNYQVENVAIRQSGVGNATIWATNSLSGTLSGVGNIRYKGDPTVSVNVSGVGRVSRL